MSIFGNIVSAIFRHPSAKTETSTGATSGTSSSSTAASPAAPAPKGTTTASGSPSTGTAMPREEVEAMIAKIAADADDDYNWKQSIVDLMKLLKLDSSLNARKQLAQELGYKGALNGSADMNIWLHQQVMTKLAESGGVVPESLKHA
jgi:hypothetical protein